MIPTRLPASADALRAALDVLNYALSTPVPLDRWRAEVEAEYAGKARTTRYRMGQALRELAELVPAGSSTEALTPELVARFASRRGKPSTTNGLLSSLRAAVSLAVRKRYVHPWFAGECRWRVPERAQSVPRHHGRESIARVLDSLQSDCGDWERHRLFVFAAILAYTGVRKMEALRARLADVELARGVLFVEPHGRPLKTSASQAAVPVPRALAKILRKWLRRLDRERIEHGGWLFPNATRATPWTGGRSGTRPADQLRAAGEAAGVRGFLPHSLRHSLATHLAHAGLSDRQIQLVLRHSNTRTQRRYIHPDVATLAALMRGFDFRPPERPRKIPPGTRIHKLHTFSILDPRADPRARSGLPGDSALSQSRSRGSRPVPRA